MAKEISGYIKLQIMGGQANPAPPVGPALGQRGINIMEFCKAFNDKTKPFAGKPIPVIITVYKDKKFDFIIKSPPASHFIKEAAKLKGGSKITDFTISEFNLNLSDISKTKFLDKINSFEQKTVAQIEKQTGGVIKRKPSRNRHKDSSSSSSSSDLSDDEDYYNFSKYRKMNQPISMWYYTPTLYNVNSVFIPTFNSPIVPYVKLWLPMFP